MEIYESERKVNTMVKFKIIQVYRDYRDYDFDDGMYANSVLLTGNTEWQECDEDTFEQILNGMNLLNSKIKDKEKEFKYMVIRIPESQSELADLSQKEFLKHVESVKKRERAAETARQAKLEAERKKKEDRERKKYLKLKSMFEPGLVAEQKNS
jgi:hypothetical protein